VVSGDGGFRSFDKRFVGRRLDGDGLFQKAVEQLAPTARIAPIKSERELVEIGIQMFDTHASLVGSKQPAFEQRDYAMNSRHQFRCGFAVPLQVCDLVPIFLAFQGQVTQPAIGMDCAARLDGILYKGNQAVCGCVQNAPHSDTADSRSIFFRCNCNHGLGLRLPAVNPFFFATHEGFINFNTPLKPIPPRPHHGAAQLVQQGPSRFVALQAQHALQPHGADAVLLASHPPHRSEPQGQRQSAVLKNRSRSHRNLTMTSRALPQQIGSWPGLPASTARAAESIRPAKLKQIRPASRLGREAPLQFQQVPRIIFHSKKNYWLWSPESSKYPSETLIDIAMFPKFIRTAYSRYLRSAQTDLLDNAMYALLNERATMEDRFTRVFSALQSLLWFVYRNGGAAGTRIPIKKLFEVFASTYSVKLDDLWPLFDNGSGASLYDIRNAIAHGEFLNPGKFMALSYAQENLNWTVERILLAILRWPIEQSKVRPEFLRSWSLAHNWTTVRSQW